MGSGGDAGHGRVEGGADPLSEEAVGGGGGVGLVGSVEDETREGPWGGDKEVIKGLVRTRCCSKRGCLHRGEDGLS